MTKNKDQEKDIPEELRKILKAWDAGILSRGEVGSLAYELFFNPLEWVEQGQTIQTIGSCCCAYHPPERTFKVEVTLQPHGYTIKRCSE